VSEQYDYLSDKDIEAINHILEGSLERAHGEGILNAIGDSSKSRYQAAQDLLDAIARAKRTTIEEEGKQE
jgi:hypothetical protein